MKKAIFFVAVAAICGAAQATVLRVNNNVGSGAPYSNVSSAINAANEGDTIMIDQSATNYGSFEVDKPLVIFGPGYFRIGNGITTEGASSAKVDEVTVYEAAAGTVLRGLEVTNTIQVYAPNVVVNRCYFSGNYGVRVEASAIRCIIHQNFFKGDRGITGISANYTQITNNAFCTYYATITGINEGYIAYNTFAYMTNGGSQINNCSNCTIEKNIARKLDTISSCSYDDNYVVDKWIYTDLTTDLTIKNQKFTDPDIMAGVTGRGAFSGDDPYVISGIPAGPVITDITVPASVEQGNTLNVTIKLGVQK